MASVNILNSIQLPTYGLLSYAWDSKFLAAASGWCKTSTMYCAISASLS